MSEIPTLILISASLALCACIAHYLRGKVRRKKAKKIVEEKRFTENLFETIEGKFDPKKYIQSPIDLNSPDLNFNN